MFRKACGWAAMLSLSLIPYSASAQTETGKRVSALYTSWDDYYFYAAFQVNDRNVTGVNNTPISQPQQDDDIEVFFETDRARAKVRTPHTFQMAVSAAGGAYFSVGANSKIPKAKVVYTYKYAAKVDGSLNDPSDTDTGYTIEVAIPWAELGLEKAPKDGTTWGFNVISRDRSSTAAPGDRFYSLSSAVQTGADVQDPSKWGTIVFNSSGTAPEASEKTVVSPRVVTRFPLINGSVVSGEWPSISRVSFGTKAILAPAPTTEEEPNTTDSPFAAPPPEPVKPPTPPTPTPPTPEPAPAPVVKAPPTGPPTSIELPGGGAIKIVPGGIHTVPGEQTAKNDSGTDTRTHRNPLTPKFPAGYTPAAPSVSLTGSLQLTPAKAPALVMAIYRVDYNADGRKAPAQNVANAQGRTQLIDQPMDGAGPWFSGLRASWHRQQLGELRRAGINVALIRARKDDPLLTKELSALVQALKQMAADGEDYPLIGVCRSGDETADYDDVYSRIPTEFRCALELPTGEGHPEPAAFLVYDADGKSDTSAKPLSDGRQIVVLSSADNIATVTPGGAHGAEIAGRRDGDAYAASWASAIDSHPAMVVIDSWNDFTHGTELAPSRQYALQYVDQTRLKTIEFNGGRQWHAKYLSEASPRTIQQKRLYQIPIRIENAGSLPWRAGEDYALCPRWYKDGRLFDDSAPRVPLGRNVAPGESITLNVGVVAVNGYGDNLEPGDYTLVFDMVQGTDRWFSYASDIPLQIPVTVLKAGDDAAATTRQDVTFLSANTPTVLGAGAAYDTQVTLRNDGDTPWAAAKTALVYKIQRLNGDAWEAVAISDGVPVSTTPVLPGQVVTVPVTIAASATGKALEPGEYRIHWYLKPASADIVTAGTHDEWIQVTDSDAAASFILSDVPRTAPAGKDVEAHLALQNLGPTAWAKTDRKVGYHWYYLDGSEASFPTLVAPLTKSVLPGRADGDIVAKFHTPDQPGRYILAWDIQLPNGSWQSAAPISRGNDLDPMVISVTGKGGATIPVDLSSAANAAGVFGKGATDGVDFDGKGDALPAEMLPPDAVGEPEVNPLLAAKPGAPLYPAGYYAGQSGANHTRTFLYPAGKNNVVVCKGQQITLPSGNYKAIHLLAAATGGSPVTATFSPGPSAKSAALTIQDWLQAPAEGSPAGWWSPYHIAQGVPTAVPCYLGDYTIAAEPNVKISSLTLPNDPSIKIVAISLEK